MCPFAGPAQGAQGRFMHRPWCRHTRAGLSQQRGWAVADDIEEVQVDGATAGWVEYDPVRDRYKARVKGDGGSQVFYDPSRAVQWVRQQYMETHTAE